jgi:predicted ArsR family transcriptional regulator
MIENNALNAPGLGESQRSILEALKRSGTATTPRLAAELGLNVETVRSHLRALLGHGLVRQGPGVRSGPGRPETVFGLTAAAEALFPRREGEVLQALTAFLEGEGKQELLGRFYERYIGSRREGALARVAHLEGRARLDEVARILSELGYMAHIEETAEGPMLRLCHCPVRELVEVTMVPCRAEVGFVTELLGEKLTRVSYIPSGHAACSYRAGARP